MNQLATSSRWSDLREAVCRILSADVSPNGITFSDVFRLLPPNVRAWAQAGEVAAIVYQDLLEAETITDGGRPFHWRWSSRNRLADALGEIVYEPAQVEEDSKVWIADTDKPLTESDFTPNDFTNLDNSDSVEVCRYERTTPPDLGVSKEIAELIVLDSLSNEIAGLPIEEVVAFCNRANVISQEQVEETLRRLSENSLVRFIRSWGWSITSNGQLHLAMNRVLLYAQLQSLEVLQLNDQIEENWGEFPVFSLFRLSGEEVRAAVTNNGYAGRSVWQPIDSKGCLARQLVEYCGSSASQARLGFGERLVIRPAKAMVVSTRSSFLQVLPVIDYEAYWEVRDIRGRRQRKRRSANGQRPRP